MFTLRTLAFLIALVALPTIASAQKPKPSPTPTPIPRTITAELTTCAAVDINCPEIHRVRQDGLGLYTNGSQGVEITGTANTSGAMIFTTQNSTTRNIIYDLTDQVVAGSPNPSIAGTTQTVKVHFYLHNGASLRVKDACSTAGACEATLTSALNGGFVIGRVNYRFQWNPTSALQYINWAGPTSTVNIHYVRTAEGAETWTVTPNVDGFGNYAAGMQVEDRNQVSPGGMYDMNFKLVIKSTPR